MLEIPDLSMFADVLIEVIYDYFVLRAVFLSSSLIFPFSNCDQNIRHDKKLRRYSADIPVFLLNPLSANLTKWSNTLKQFYGKLPKNCLSVFDHFLGLALKGLTTQGILLFLTALRCGSFSKKISKKALVPS